MSAPLIVTDYTGREIGYAENDGNGLLTLTINDATASAILRSSDLAIGVRVDLTGEGDPS